LKSKQVQEFKETEIGKIPADWGVGSFLTDLKIKGRIGWKGYKTSDLRFQGPLVIGGENIKNSFFLFLSTVKHLSREKFEESPEIMLKQNNILVVTRGNGIGKVGFFDGSIKEATINPTLIIISDFKGIPKFLFYYLLSKQGKENLLSIASGSSIPAIYQGSLKKLHYPKPTEQIQERISKILYALDTKIHNLQNQNKVLEQITQAIFKSWFIDFDGVTEFEDSELGKIPKGWEVVPVGTVIELIYGKSLTKKNRIPGSIPVYGSSGIVGYHNQSLYDGPGIIVGRKGNVGSLFWSQSPFYAIDTVYYVKTKIPLTYVYENFLNQNFINSDSSVPGLQREQAYSLLILIPDEYILNKFEKHAMYCRTSIISNKLKIDYLLNIRDSLLPKLMSGEIRV